VKNKMLISCVVLSIWYSS